MTAGYGGLSDLIAFLDNHKYKNILQTCFKRYIFIKLSQIVKLKSNNSLWYIKSIGIMSKNSIFAFCRHLNLLGGRIVINWSLKPLVLWFPHSSYSILTSIFIYLFTIIGGILLQAIRNMTPRSPKYIIYFSPTSYSKQAN